MKAHELDNLAVMFRTNDPNLGHCSTLEKMLKADMAYSYGLYRGMPERYTRARARLRATIADTLSRKAKGLQ